MSPVRSVRGPSDVGVIVGGEFSGGCFGTTGKIDVHGFEEDFSHFDGGPHNDGERAEAEVHDLAVLLGEFMEGTVGEGAHEVQVSDDRPGFGTWW